MAATSFGTAGSTPNIFNAVTSAIPQATLSTPVANALNKAQSTAPNMSTVNGPKYAPPPVMPSAPTNQSVSSHSVTDAAGNTTTQKYDTSTPQSGMLGKSNQTVAAGANTPGYTYTNGVLSSVGGQPTGGTSTPAPTGSTVASGSGSAIPQPITGNTTTPSGATVNPPVAPTTTTPLSTATTGLLNSPANNTAIGVNAKNIADNYGQQIAEVGNLGAGTIAGDVSTGTAPVGQGAANAASAAESNRISALGTAENAALAGTGQQLTAQGQAQSGLLGAGQLASPSNQYLTAPYSSQVLDANGQPVGGTSGTLQTAVTNAINQIKAGGGYDAANATLSSFGPAGTNALLTALGPNFNINASNAEAAAQASNINTQGTLNTNIGAAGAQQATQNYVAANTAYETASQQATNLQSTLTSTGINTNPQFVNQKINALTNQLGSANYASFITALNETKQAYTSLLSSVGASTPTVNGQQATDIFNENSTPAQINAAIDALNTAAYAKLKPLYDQIGTYSSIGSSSNSNANSTTANSWH